MTVSNRISTPARVALGLLALCSLPALAQSAADAAFFQRARVANYAVEGQDHGSQGFERFSFWSDDAGRTRVLYSYGSSDTEVNLQPGARSADGKAFSLRFPNGHVLDVAPSGDALQVTDRKGRYDKRFEWQYEGPVDGRGTFCTPCVEEKDATAFVRARFLK